MDVVIVTIEFKLHILLILTSSIFQNFVEARILTSFYICLVKISVV